MLNHLQDQLLRANAGSRYIFWFLDLNMNILMSILNHSRLKIIKEYIFYFLDINGKSNWQMPCIVRMLYNICVFIYLFICAPVPLVLYHLNSSSPFESTFFIQDFPWLTSQLSLLYFDFPTLHFDFYFFFLENSSERK